MFARSGIVAGLLVAALVGVAKADAVTDWNGVLLQTIKDESLTPPEASRAMAMMNIAMYDVINSYVRSHEPYLVMGTPAAGSVRDVAAAYAARRVLSELFPGQATAYDTALDDFLLDLPELVYIPSRDYGESIANLVLDSRHGDNSDVTVDYTPGTAPGSWQPTPPANAAALLPNWAYVTPFAMVTPSQFRQSGPPALSSGRYARDFNEVKELGDVNSATRTTEQTAIANFWADGAGTYTPPGHWIQIAITIVNDQGNTLEQNARVFALLGITLADAAICAWDNKYAYEDWRPITGIRNAGTDDNADTAADAGWTPLLTTPAFPSYTSGHSTFSGAATRMIEILYGRDDIAFDSSVDDVTRSFESLSQAAEEAGRSRVYGGIHWQYDNEDGLAAGRQLASYVHANFLQRVQTTSSASSSSLCGGGGLFTSTLMLFALPLMRLSARRRRFARR